MTDREWLMEMFKMLDYKFNYMVIVQDETPELLGPPMFDIEPVVAANENIHPLVRFNTAISEPGALL